MFPLDSDIRLSVLFTLGGVPKNPSLVTLYVTDPNGAVATLVFGVDLAIANPSAGVFTYDPPTNISGRWTCCWRGTAPVKAATLDFQWDIARSVYAA